MFGQSVEVLKDCYNDQKALLIGNGLSREELDLTVVKKDYDVVFGCNVLYLEFIPDFIVTQNYNILLEYFQKNIVKHCKVIYKTGAYIDKRRFSIHNDLSQEKDYYFIDPTRFSKKNTGFIALNIMLLMRFGEIHFIGMDMDVTNMFHNKHNLYMLKNWNPHINLNDFNDVINKNKSVKFVQINNTCLQCDSIWI